MTIFPIWAVSFLIEAMPIGIASDAFGIPRNDSEYFLTSLKTTAQKLSIELCQFFLYNKMRYDRFDCSNWLMKRAATDRTHLNHLIKPLRSTLLY